MRIKQFVEESKNEYIAMRVYEGIRAEAVELSDIEDSIAWYWMQRVAPQIQWEHWGEGVQDGCADVAFLAKPMREISAGMDSIRGVTEYSQALAPHGVHSNVVAGAQTRHMVQHAGVRQAGASKASSATPAYANGSKNIGLEVDPVSGLEVHELPGYNLDQQPPVGPQSCRPRSHQQRQVMAADADFVVSAPEFQEEFGSLPEHSEDPLTGGSFPISSGKAGSGPQAHASAVAKWTCCDRTLTRFMAQILQ